MTRIVPIKQPSRLRAALIICLACGLAACPASTPTVPYPAYVQTDELSDVFLATLPGVRAKRFAEDYSTRTGRYRVDLPTDWTGTSGGVPDASLEIFVLAGELIVGDVKLITGGYAYLPSGSLGFRLSSPAGARVLYILSGPDPTAVIRAPILHDGVAVEWTDEEPGRSVRVLRADPGSGARTWLLKTTPAAAAQWRTSSTSREGYLVSGSESISECVEGKEHAGTYTRGGYFLRSPGAIFGGGESGVSQESVWFLREVSKGAEIVVSDCG